MIVDTSAIVSIVKHEPGYGELAACIAQADTVLMSAASYVELFAVSGREPRSAADLHLVLDGFGIRVASFDEDQARAAVSAYQRFGRGSGHPARLNMGDTYSYALAQVRSEPLLFVGNDFTHTDILPALD